MMGFSQPLPAADNPDNLCSIATNAAGLGGRGGSLEGAGGMAKGVPEQRGEGGGGFEGVEALLGV